jgi:hypothetical protein
MGITCPGRLNLYWRKLAMIMNSSSLMTGQLTIRLLLFLIEALKAEALVGTIERIVRAEEPCAALAAFTSALRDTLEERPSPKHMAGSELGRMEPSPSPGYMETYTAHAIKAQYADITQHATTIADVPRSEA